MSLHRWMLSTIALGAGTLASGQQAPPPPSTEFAMPGGVGVNIHFTDPKPGEMEQLAAGGFRWARMDFGWAGIERKPGEYDFSAYDRLLASLEKSHVRPYFILDYSNPHYDDGLSPHTDAGRAAFARWAAAAVRHFKGRGVLWEMYNEPNIGFWKPSPNTDDYIKLALATGRAIREAEPGEVYIGPATSTIDLPFLEACFKAGCLEYWSAVSVHPYRQKDPETVEPEYRALRRLIAQYAPKDRHIPIISGEWGYSSSWKDFDEERQAKYLPREMLVNAINEVPVSIWYDWHDDGRDASDPEHRFGTAHFDERKSDKEPYEPKAAYLAMKEMADALGGFRFNKRLDVGSPDDYLLLFDRDGVGMDQRLVAWTTAINGHTIFLPVDEVTASSQGKPVSFDANERADVARLPITGWVTYVTPKHPLDALRIAAAWSRAPQEIVAQGPGVARVPPTRFKNPLDLAVVIGAEPNGQTIAPGATCAIEAGENISRDASAPPIRSSLILTGSLASFVQRTDVIVANPLRAILLPRANDAQSARIENASGEAVRAEARLTGDAEAPTVPVEIASGERSKIIAFKLPPSLGSTARLGLSMRSGNEKLLDAAPLRLTALPAGPGAWKLEADGDRKVASEQSLSSDAPPGGPIGPGVAVFKIAYRMDAGWKFLQLKPRDESAAKVAGKPQSLDLWVYGDSQNHLARIRFTDATGQTFQPDGTRITWTGWRHVSFPLTGVDTNHWGGAKDGTINYPIRLDTLFLLDNTGRRATKGEVYISAPMLTYAE